MNQTGYDNCTTKRAIGNLSSGKDFIPLIKTIKVVKEGKMRIDGREVAKMAMMKKKVGGGGKRGDSRF